MHPHLCKGLKRSASIQRGGGSGHSFAGLLRLLLKFSQVLQRIGALTQGRNLVCFHYLPKEGRRDQVLGVSFKFKFTT